MSDKVSSRAEVVNGRTLLTKLTNYGQFSKGLGERRSVNSDF